MSNWPSPPSVTGSRVDRLSSGLPGRCEMLFKGSYFSGAAAAANCRATWRSKPTTCANSPCGCGRRRATASGRCGPAAAAASRCRPTSASRRRRCVSPTPTSNSMASAARVRSPSPPPGAVRSISTLDSGRFDLDAYAPQGIPAVSGGGRGRVRPAACWRSRCRAPMRPTCGSRCKAGELLLNAVTAQDVALDLQSGANGLDLRALEHRLGRWCQRFRLGPHPRQRQGCRRLDQPRRQGGRPGRTDQAPGPCRQRGAAGLGAGPRRHGAARRSLR